MLPARPHIRRPEAGCLAKVKTGAAVVTLSVVCAATAVEGGSELRVQSNGLVKIGDGLIVLTLLEICTTAGIERGSVVRIELDSCVEVGKRVSVVLPCKICITPVLQCNGPDVHLGRLADVSGSIHIKVRVCVPT